MAIYKVTYSEKYRRATLHNWGCNFRCRGCSYKLLGRGKPEKFPTMEEIQEALSGLKADAVHFMGGEPTTNPQLPELLRFCKEKLGLKTRLGHTNGSRFPLPNLDAAYVSFKAFDDALHREYTGHPAQPVYDNFKRAHQAGLELRASAVFIPDYIGYDQIEKLCQFLVSLDASIPFHIMGYVPVPGTEWRRPSDEEMQRAVAIAQRRLATVGFSHLTPDQMLNPTARDDRFVTKRIL
ncbi:MAG: radical SAM protein [Planctomycetes bacterium]|nr:radical SAM protein [Planctomycetota bacterium]